MSRHLSGMTTAKTCLSGGAECKRRKGDIDMKNDETTRRHDEDDASIW